MPAALPPLHSLRRVLLYLLALRAILAAPWEETNAAWNVNAHDGAPADYYGRWPGHQYFPSPPDWRTIPIYQLITDRFADGDPTNNVILPDNLADYDVRDLTLRHGGDFRGLISKLDYIHGLGVRAIWISPVFQNGFNDYHGYAQRDFTLIDKRMGTVEELRELTTQAHARGIYVLIDVVVNHMANLLSFEGVESGGAAFRTHDGEYRLLPRAATASPTETTRTQRVGSGRTVHGRLRCTTSTATRNTTPGAAATARATSTATWWTTTTRSTSTSARSTASWTTSTESPSVQASTSPRPGAHPVDRIDGFRVVQVDLGFFKWAPRSSASPRSRSTRPTLGCGANSSC